MSRVIELAKRALLWFLIAAVVLWAFRNPDLAGNLLGNVWGLLMEGFNAVGRLLSGMAR